jgi:hypothetical protein
MRAGRENLGKHSHGKAGLGELKGATHAGSAGAHHHYIELAAW